jgi:hypothetical protein
MRRTLIPALLVAGACAGTALCQDRLAVLEFLARQSTYCIAGAPAVITLQEEMAGRAVLLEYDFDAPLATGRFQCYRAADPYGGYLPLVMVGSGFRTSSGPVDYEPVYRGMIEQELARAPDAAVTAYSRRQGNALRLYVEAENRTGAALGPANESAIWVIVWENGRIRLTNTLVRSVVKSPLAASVPPGGRVTAIVDTPTIAGVNWQHVESLALLERRTAVGARFDMLQATVAQAASLSVSPAQVALSRTAAAADVALAGPHALAWTAQPESAWLEVVPAGGSLPATATVRTVAGAMPPPGSVGTVRFDAAGDGMAFSAAVTVTVEHPRGTLRRRLHSVSCAPAPGR